MAGSQSIVIVGAGIAGLTTALAAARAGFAVVVCERASHLSEVGAGIQLSPNAGRILDDLGLNVTDTAVEPTAIDVRNGKTGARLSAIPVEAFRERYGFPYRVIHRADLQAALVTAVKRIPAIRLILGATLGGRFEREDELLVKVTGGHGEVIPAIAVVGADGVWSATRAAIPNASEARPVGRTAWRTVVPRDNLPDEIAENHVGLWIGPGAHLVHYPIAQGAAVNVVAIVQENLDRPGWSARGDYRQIARAFAAWAEPIRAITNTPQSWQKWALNVVDPHGPWHSGKTALIGDAAHAMRPFLAQGAAMAIEDAVVLVRHLARANGDVDTRLAAYDAERKPRVGRVWHAAKRTGDHYHLTGLPAGVRDATLRLAGPRLVLARNDWIYRWRDPSSGNL